MHLPHCSLAAYLCAALTFLLAGRAVEALFDVPEPNRTSYAVDLYDPSLPEFPFKAELHRYTYPDTERSDSYRLRVSRCLRHSSVLVWLKEFSFTCEGDPPANCRTS